MIFSEQDTLPNGVTIPRLALGTWFLPNQQAAEAVKTALSIGYRHIDTAQAYGNEAGVGEGIRRSGIPREEIFVTSKVAAEHKSYATAAQSIHQTLTTMGLDYVDIFYHHRMDPNTPLEETMGALAQAVRSGKALYAGLSNYDGPTLEKAAAILDELHVPFVINQNRYSIFDRTIEHNGLKDTAAKLHKGIITFSPLAQGLLTDRYLHGIPADSRVHTDGRFLKEKDITPERLAQISALNDLARQRGQTLAEMALAWLLHHDEVTTVLIGASKTQQILDNIKAVEHTTFTPDELAVIDRISK